MSNNIYFNGVDEIGGVTYVTVQHNGRIYRGVSRCHPDDNYNSITGGRIAETRASINALKGELRIKKAEYKVIKNYIKALKCYKDFDSKEKSYKVVYKQLNTRIKEIEELKNNIQSMELGLSATFKTQDRIKQKNKLN